MEFLILLALILLNGVFALSEIAVVSSRKSRLQEQAEAGNHNAQIALQLSNDPNRFLSTVQVGITLVGVGAGAFGGTAIAQDIAALIRTTWPALSIYADQIGFALIVGLTTYLSLVIGELVPKRIALYNPEQAAMVLARPMAWLSSITAPVVFFLSQSTTLLTKLLGVQGDGANSVTDFEVIAMMREGIESGDFEQTEHHMVKSVLQLDDTRVREIVTPRTAISWLPIDASPETLRQHVINHTFSAYPVCGEDIDDVVGAVRSKDLLTQLLNNQEVNLQAIMHPPLFVPETVRTSDVLQQFKSSPVHMALVVGEFGGIEGLITIKDIVEEILGDLDMDDPQAIKRDNGSWLIDGNFPMSDMVDVLSHLNLPEDEKKDYSTLSGFIMKRLERIPETSDNFHWAGHRFEVVDMDGKRIDKVLVEIEAQSDEGQTADANETDKSSSDEQTIPE